MNKSRAIQMWAKFRVSKITRGGKELKECKSLNVNEEYLSALRTKSYADFFTKAQLLVNERSSPSYSCYPPKFSETLLEPDQDTIPSILESAIFSKVPGLKALMLNYFDISAEASKICSHLLKDISQIQYNYQFIQRALDAFDDYHSPDKDFKLIHDKYSSVLNHLKSKRKKVVKKIELINCVHKASGICIMAVCGLVTLTAIVMAAHTLAALLMAPMIFSFPLKSFKKKLFSFPYLKSDFLQKIREQLDVAAKGTYILNRDFDTISRLVARLHNEVDHNKAMIQICLERREDKIALQVVKELKKSSSGLRKQIEELEEHVYLCLVTINRARTLVVKQITTHI
ncbi:hypothetical protein SLEP1_g4647 [Rubroshorea leprosula]|uniref:Uncharacterized protein n=1 Tax=Rubroshorea leprosula TaxID=152421 RepID=A0AAV5HVA3_9ROSI|nr:hypothetical protein SLEP1_g4647 [Rubroshorea leprosula]